MDINRKRWNDRHQKLNRTLAKGDRDTAIELFLAQHAMVHSDKVARTGLWSFEDELLHGLNDARIRQIPPNGEHSIAWILLHLARIEDITMNMLVAGTEQIFIRNKWAKKLKVTVLHSANKMDAASIAKLSAEIDIKALRAYRIAVGKRTRQIALKLQAHDLKQKVDLARIKKVISTGAVTRDAMEIIHYWSKKTIAGLLLMPPTRHCILHLNEAMRIKKKLTRS